MTNWDQVAVTLHHFRTSGSGAFPKTLLMTIWCVILDIVGCGITKNRDKDQFQFSRLQFILIGHMPLWYCRNVKQKTAMVLLAPSTGINHMYWLTCRTTASLLKVSLRSDIISFNLWKCSQIALPKPSLSSGEVLLEEWRGVKFKFFENYSAISRYTIGSSRKRIRKYPHSTCTKNNFTPV